MTDELKMAAMSMWVSRQTKALIEAAAKSVGKRPSVYAREVTEQAAKRDLEQAKRDKRAKKRDSDDD